MKLEVGMYVRTKRGQIGKITTIGKDNIAIEFNEMWQDIILKENIIKASFDVIDLIEVGDYVNGSKVISIKTDENNIKWVYTNNENAYGYKNDEIRNIVTREQFEELSFKVGD